jgi:phosphoribosylamine--glycine ligase
MVPLLRHHGYRGPLDLNAIVNDDGVWGLEFTPRFGFDALPALLEMLTEDFADIINSYARGARVTQFPIRTEGCGAGLRVSIPPYPFEENVTAPRGVAIRGLVRADRMHSYFYNVFLDDEGVLRSSGAFGAIGVFTGFGDDLCSAIAKCEEIAKRAEIRDKQYRTDLGHEFHEAYEQYEEQRTKKEYPARPEVPVLPDGPMDRPSPAAAADPQSRLQEPVTR